MKTYKAIFFDWDGTAVRSRKEPADKVAACMKPLLEKGVKLIIISGTTYDKIAEGRLHGYFTEKELDKAMLEHPDLMMAYAEQEEAVLKESPLIMDEMDYQRLVDRGLEEIEEYNYIDDL